MGLAAIPVCADDNAIPLEAFIEAQGVRERLEAGKVVAFEETPDGKEIHFDAVFPEGRIKRYGGALHLFLVDASLDEVWAVETDIAVHEEFLPDIHSIEILSEGEALYEVHYEYNTPVGIADNYATVVPREELRVISWHLDTSVKKQVLTESQTFWHVRAYDRDPAKSLIAYYQNVVPKGWWRRAFYKQLGESKKFAEAMKEHLDAKDDGSAPDS